MKHVHILPVSVFTDSFIEFINTNFPFDDQCFYIYGNFDDYKKSNYKNIFELNNDPIKFIKFLYQINIAQNLYFHSLFNQLLVRALFLQPWLLRKSAWLIWGGDLYYHVTRDKSFKSNINELVRTFVIKNIGRIITHIYGDYKLAKKWYGAKGRYFYSFMYTSNLYKEHFSFEKNKYKDKIIVQIGNSADPTNNHIEILNKLKKYSLCNIKLICPLSYGDTQYINKIIDQGKKIFEDKFFALTEFIPFDDYIDILAQIDIAIFNHKRQQAMGNITTLLGLGKKVYIREEITTWQFCIDHDLKVYSANGDYKDLFILLDDETKRKNIENVKKKFSREKLIEDWKNIFNGDDSK